ncbi:DUF885 family protein [uncultured Sphingomonas sp.]|uniref:DUF885 domain-containing protein n=1 Tax=uncultured Sphingomonas sp. TaxID=158754 RepID=UPI0026131655|nr:DUF885 family protein [uncultured Sphingomonas sp.]
MFDLNRLHRRDLLGAAAAGGALALVPGRVLAQAAISAPFHATLASFADRLLVLSPDTSTSLGLDHGTLAPLRSRLSDLSQAGIEKANATIRAIHAQLLAIDRAGLPPADQLRYDTVRYATERGIDGTAFRYGGGAASGFQGGTTPYVVSQQNGAVSNVPEFLVSVHAITDKADADAYLARIAGFARQLDQETGMIRQHAAIGVMPPKFIADNALGILKQFRGVPAAQQRFVTNLAEKAKALGLSGDYGAQAAKLVESAVYPALDREIAAFIAATANAPMTAGVQRLPDGDAYYRWALRLGTTTTQTPQEVHRIGLAQNAEIKARMDTLLKAQGLTKGSVGERVSALNKDPRFLYPDTDKGRAQLIAYLNGRLAAVRPIMPKLSHLGLHADVMIKRVPADIQDGAALGYMNPAALDGSRPAIYYVNLKSTSLWPRYQLATLTAHEGIPGHTWQLGYLAEHHAEVPVISSLTGFNAFVEGWALYAEQLIDESGLYDDDPWSRLGYLQAQQFRACRLVADTGLHAMGWSREQTVGFLSAESGKGRDAMTSETDRYCASPGQACGYKTGHNEIVRQRDKTKAALGAKFDLAAYDDVVVKTCGIPLELLGGVVDSYIARATSA